MPPSSRCPNIAHACVRKEHDCERAHHPSYSTEAERASGVLRCADFTAMLPDWPIARSRAHRTRLIGERLHVLQDDLVNHQGQPIALVIAETLEGSKARVLRLVRVTYAAEPADTDIRRRPSR